MIDHEKALIGIIINNPELFSVASPIINTTDFTDINANIIWMEMEELDNESIETSRHYVCNAISSRLKGDATATIEYITDSCRYFEGDVLEHARVIKKKTKEADFLRDLDIAKSRPSPSDYILQALERLHENNNDKSKTFKDLINSVVDYIDSSVDGISGLETGIPAIDRLTGGLQGGRVYTVAARPSVGKTALTTQIGLNIAARSEPVGVCSLEMGDSELGLRSIAKTCQTPIDALERGDDLALGKMTAGMKSLNLTDWPIHFNTDDDDLDAIIGQIRVWKIKHDIKLVLVDHVGLISVAGEDLKRIEIGKSTRALKKLAKELDIPIIITSQLNRSVTKMDREPNLSDLKESGNIEEDSDFVMFLHEQYDNGAYNHHKFIVAKNRQGKKGYAGAGFYFNGDTQTFTEIASDSFAERYSS